MSFIFFNTIFTHEHEYGTIKFKIKIKLKFIIFWKSGNYIGIKFFFFFFLLYGIRRLISSIHTCLFRFLVFRHRILFSIDSQLVS